MIEVTNLTKKYGTRVAVDGLNFSISAGEIVGFLGPNGAGKTTTMNIMTGFIAATTGEVRIDGLDILEEPERVKANIGYLPDTPPVYGEMRVCEYLNFVADIKGIHKNRVEMIDHVIKQVDISEQSRRLIKNLSRGYRQRVGLAQAMLGEPKVIIMDEPTIGLDPKQIMEMRDVVKRLGERHTVILSSHIMQEVSAVCDRVLIINQGKIVAEGTPEGLSDGLQKSGGQMKVIVKGERNSVLSALSEVPLITSIDANEGKEPSTIELLLGGEGGADIREAVFHCMSKNNLPILQMKPTELSLEEIFLLITR